MEVAPPSPLGAPEVKEAASHRLWALLLLVAAIGVCGWRFVGPTWTAGPREFAPGVEKDALLDNMGKPDVMYEAWLVGRNARTILERPSAIFATEHCYPAKNSLTYGVPMITMGVLGAPIVALSGEPVLTYNAAIVLTAIVAAAAMYLLVADLTASPLAAALAAVLFTFTNAKVLYLYHPSVWDTSWTVLAFFFLRRLLAFGRWRDALGLGLSTALQLAADFYPTLTAAMIAPPFLCWALWRYGIRRVSLAQIVCVLSIVAAALWFIFTPYVQTRADGRTLTRATAFYATWDTYAPGGPFAPNMVALGLALVALLLPKRRLQFAAGDPRLALLAGALLAMALSMGPELVPRSATPLQRMLGPVDLYAAVARVLPGLETIRGVARISAGVHLMLTVLAGIATAAVLKSVRYKALAASALMVLAVVEILRFPLAAGASLRITAWDVRPDRATIGFFNTVGLRGSSGPIFETPFDDADGLGRFAWSPTRIMTSFFHRRRTSACFGSFDPPQHHDLVPLAQRLPELAALEELRAMGFTTLVVHEPYGARFPARLAIEQACREGRGLKLIARNREHLACDITAEAAP